MPGASVSERKVEERATGYCRRGPQAQRSGRDERSEGVRRKAAGARKTSAQLGAAPRAVGWRRRTEF